MLHLPLNFCVLGMLHLPLNSCVLGLCLVELGTLLSTRLVSEETSGTEHLHI